MTIEDSAHPEDLLAFVSGQLTEAETEAVINHLVECDDCLEAVDLLWNSQSAEAGPGSISSLDAATVQRLEQQLLRRIHRSNLAGRAVWLGTSGLMETYLTMLPPLVETCLVLLRPALNWKQPSTFRKGSKND
ncbi:MAG: zf-HC2 domain-containing protein [Anaerolineae bacterium]|nr:zf-HC2 domain-containing protein [Anaerolineae bacterium]